MNQGYEYRSVVAGGDAGRTLLEHLAGRYTHSAAEVWSERIAQGQVQVDGRAGVADERLRAGQRLAWRRPPWQEPEVPLAFAVLHRDEHLLAVAKPRGLPTLPNGGFLEHTLLAAVRRHAPEAVPLHRLGRGTSGVVLFARTDVARRALSLAWREPGLVEKTYRALVAGVPERPAFSVDAAIGRVPHPRLGTVYAAASGGKRSLSHVRVLEARPDTALVEVVIETGRPHQIRIHMAAAGHPLVGDPLYAVGGVPRADPGLPGDAGYRLHSLRLVLTHPETGARVAIECAPPPPLRE